jgi:DNA-binding LacI/PurR family transcriptional regulator/DNA-binding transcriptional regulator YhcF (GntR family)
VSSLQIAISLIVEGLDNHVWRDGDRLPSLSVLARMAGVSRGTMWKAVADLKLKGRVNAREGSRIYAGPARTKQHETIVDSHSCDAKRILFEQDLLKGYYVTGRPLPSLSELQARYGVSYRMMRKILNTLASEGIISALKKKFYLPRRENRPFRDSVCLLWEGETYGSGPRPSREGRIVESLQRECAMADTALMLKGFETADPGFIKTISKQFGNDDSVIGYILRPMMFREPSERAKHIDLLLELSTGKKPIAILDELGLFTLPEPLASNRLIKVFVIAGMTAGRDVGRMLLTSGHKKVAFITNNAGELWSKMRYQGLSHEFARAGYADSVSLYAMENPQDLINGLLSPRNHSSTHSHRGSSGSPAGAGDKMELATRFAHLEGIVRSRRDAVQKVQRSMQDLLRFPRRSIHKRINDYLVIQGRDWLTGELQEIFMEYLFDKAAADNSCTAWVVVTDEAAVFALNYLRSHNRKVPQDISVVGFDGDPLGLDKGLTSFDFDFSAIARQMLSFVSHPMTATTFTKGSRIEMPGFIVHRSSAGRA